MPVVVFVSPKGGVGKTTACTVLGLELAAQASVVMIDADPNRPLASWAKLEGRPESIEVMSDVTENTIIDAVDEAAKRAPFVLVDCEGTASLTVSSAIGAADLVIVPTQGSQLDAKEAAKAMSLVRNAQRQLRRPIAHTVLFTRTSPAVKPRTLGDIQAQFTEHGIPVMRTSLNEREAFRALFSFGGTLKALPSNQVSNVGKAEANARAFAAEVIELLKAPNTEKVEAAQ